MTIECFIENDEILKEGLFQLERLLQSDLNKQLIINTINMNMNTSFWPTSYYKIRDEILPQVFGEICSKVFFWCVFGGMIVDTEERTKLSESILSSESLSFLNYITLTYCKDFIKAKKYNTNPIGYDEVNFTYDTATDNVKLIFSRNDGQNLLLQVKDEDVVNITNELLEFYVKVTAAKGQELNYEDKSKIKKIIKSLEILSVDNDGK